MNICTDTPNLLNRDFYAVRPNQKWVTGISYIKTKQGFFYLSVIRDLYDNCIVAYKRKEKGTAELHLHSDQGFQYTSQEYFKLTQSLSHYTIHVKTQKPI